MTEVICAHPIELRDYNGDYMHCRLCLTGCEREQELPSVVIGYPKEKS